MFNFYKTVELTPERRRAAERDSILSACSGAMGDITLTDSAVIILFAGMIGASDMFSMITSSLMPLFNGLCIIPMAWLASKFGNQGLILRAGMVSITAYLLVVASPFFGVAAVPMMISMLMLFAFCHTGYVAGWFPMLDTFLSKERRGAYLSKMRFCWQLSAAAFIFIAGLCIGGNPPLWQLQLILLIAAIIFSARIFFIARIPVFKTEKKEAYSFGEGLAQVLRNKPLAGYSVYLFVLNLAAYGTIPLMTLYMKRHLQAPDNVTVLISSVSLTGMLLGSLCAGSILKKYGIKSTFLGIHLAYAAVNMAIFFIGKDTFPAQLTYFCIAALMFVYSFSFANANIASTSEMMSLASPGNKVMAMAFCGTFYYSGSGLSRMVTSLVLGSGMLAPEWMIGTVKFCHYQTIFLIYSIAIVFAAMLLVVVPAIFPKGEYIYASGN